MDDLINTAAEVAEGDALPRMHEVHCDPEAQKAADKPLPKGIAKKSVAQKSPAQWAYERTILYLKKFEEGLDEDHEIAMGFAGTDAGVLKIEGMGYFDPDIVTFYGADAAGARMQLVQHVSQLSVLFRALPRRSRPRSPTASGSSCFRIWKRATREPLNLVTCDKSGVTGRRKYRNCNTTHR